jgi:hypothetical protein
MCIAPKEPGTAMQRPNQLRSRLFATEPPAAQGVVAVDVERVSENEQSGRVIYRVTLSCGCSYWEHRSASAIRPMIGTAASCWADHGAAAPARREPT